MTFSLLATVLMQCAHGASVFRDFIKVQGDQLTENGQPFRFISWNIPNLQLIEDNVAFKETNPWRLPDRFELTDALGTVRQLGGTVVRTYVLSVKRTNDTPEIPRHVLGPGKFNEEAFRALDLALQVANEQGVRLIIPLVDNWPWMGGRAEYAGFRGRTKDEFWTDPQLIADFKETIRFVLLRTNTYSGVRYCDDKAVLCWETGNEISSPVAWTREIAAYLKSLDHNHLVMDGFNASELRPESLTLPEVDIVTTHHYPGSGKSFAQVIRENAEKAKGKKPYVAGEFGFVDTPKMAEAMETIRDTGMSGGLLWSLRFRNRDGGFYWHSEPAGGNQYKAFHWPASQMGAAYDEMNLMALVRKQAFAIRGLPEPVVPVPAPPTLLPITDAGAISWQGSVAATSYIVERAASNSGSWTVAGDTIYESLVQYRPLFADTNVSNGRWHYRVRARNEAGVSQPSNMIGPVTVTHATLVDEMADFSLVHSHTGALKFETHDCRKAKEDAHRLAVQAGSEIVYERPTAISAARIYTFFAEAVAEFKVSVSADGKRYAAVPSSKQMFFSGAGDYGYWKPVLFECSPPVPGARFLKIEFTGDAQIGRIEIESR